MGLILESLHRFSVTAENLFPANRPVGVTVHRVFLLKWMKGEH